MNRAATLFGRLDLARADRVLALREYSLFPRLLKAVVLAGMALAAHASEPQCVFNPHAYSAETYRKRPDVAYVRWIESGLRAAIVSRTGRLVAIEHWSCIHNGAEARMYLDASDKALDIPDALEELASILLTAKEAQKVRPLIAAHAFRRDGIDRLDFPSEGYEEFFASSQSLGPVLLLTLRYYRD
jgi:hypothetical protein